MVENARFVSVSAARLIRDALYSPATIWLPYRGLLSIAAGALAIRWSRRPASRPARSLGDQLPRTFDHGDVHHLAVDSH